MSTGQENTYDHTAPQKMYILCDTKLIAQWGQGFQATEDCEIAPASLQEQ